MSKTLIYKTRWRFLPILNYLLIALFCILCAGTLFVNTSTFTDNQILPKWLFAFMGLGVIGIVFSVMLLAGKKYVCNMKVLNAMIVILCFLQAGYGILQFCNILPPSSATYKVTGSFDNPAGFAGSLCAGLPFTVYFLLDTNIKSIRWSGWFAMLIISIGILMSESRTGLLCIAIVSIVHFVYYNVKKLHGRKAIIGFCFSLILFLASAILLFNAIYQWKKNSADGRLLIWKCTWEMIKDKPITGHGIGAFEAHYMDYQAKYFEEHPNSQFTMLADNVKHPFNEFLSIGVQFGVIGWGCLLALAIFLVYCYRRHPSQEGFVSLLALVSVAVFSSFSYPFTYPFPWIITVLGIGVLIGKGYGNLRFSQMNMMKKAIAICLLVASAFLLFTVGNRIKAEMEWKRISRLSLRGQTYSMLPHYQHLLATLGKEPYFLYNYAAELCVAKRYDDCLKTASACRKYWADYDLEVLQAEALIGLEQYEKTKHYLEKAATMCPVRFVPLYRLHYVYKKMKNEKEANRLAHLIIEKPVKVESDIVRAIKREMRLYCDNTVQ